MIGFFFPEILEALFILMLFYCREEFDVHSKCDNQIAPGSMLSCYLLTLEGSVCKGTKDRAGCTLVICWMNSIFFKMLRIWEHKC